MHIAGNSENAHVNFELRNACNDETTWHFSIKILFQVENLNCFRNPIFNYMTQHYNLYKNSAEIVHFKFWFTGNPD